jgi:hypothetical protein
MRGNRVASFFTSYFDTGALTCEYVKNGQIPSWYYSNHNTRSHYFGQETACIVFLFKNELMIRTSFVLKEALYTLSGFQCG